MPDLVVEVLYSDKQRDRVTKFKAYAKVGVPEYWIVDPEQETVAVFVLRGETFVPLGNFDGETVVRSEVMRAWDVSADQLF